jgi:hypothetical protein
MNKIEEIIKLLNGNEVRFDTPVQIKGTPHSPIMGIEEIAVDDKNVWVKVYKGNWSELQETDRSFDMVANSILQRLRLLKKALA